MTKISKNDNCKTIGITIIVPKDTNDLSIKFKSTLNEWIKMPIHKKKRYCAVADLLEYPIIPFKFILKRFRCGQLRNLAYVDQRAATENYIKNQVDAGKLIVIAPGPSCLEFNGKKILLNNRYNGRYYLYDQNR